MSAWFVTKCSVHKERFAESEAAKKTGNTEQAGKRAPHKESGERH
jgi:hypothetical protein